MAETPFNISDALKPDGFVDFYELLGVAPDASSDDLRSRINALYSEAQANRDHRNMNRRREYQTLLELLPQARTALLEPDKRAQYDAYAAQAGSGTATQDFTAFMAELSGVSAGDDSTDVLGVQSGGTTASATPRATTKPAPAPSRIGVDAPATPRRTQAANRAQQGLIGSAISVIAFFVVLLIAHLALKQPIPISVLIAAVVGVVVWVATHRGNKTAI